MLIILLISQTTFLYLKLHKFSAVNSSFIFIVLFKIGHLYRNVHKAHMYILTNRKKKNHPCKHELRSGVKQWGSLPDISFFFLMKYS